jgi:hypothetical protein
MIIYDIRDIRGEYRKTRGLSSGNIRIEEYQVRNQCSVERTRIVVDEVDADGSTRQDGPGR